MSSLLRVLRARHDSAQLRGEVRRADAGALARQIVDHGLCALVAAPLRAADFEPRSLALIEEQARAIVASSLRVKALTLRVVDALSAAGLHPLLLKGYALAARLYEQPLARPMTDVDLLVPEEALPETTRALEAMGLRRVETPPDEAEPNEHHVAFVGAPVPVEVHYLPTSGLGRNVQTSALTRSAIDADLEGRRIRQLAPADELTYLAIHGAQHLFLRLSWLVDLELFSRRIPFDSASVAQAARGAGLAAAAFAGLDAAQRHLGAMVDMSMISSLVPAGWQRAALRRLFSEERLCSGAVARSDALAPLARTLLCQTPGDAARHLWMGAQRKLSRR